MEFKDIVMQRYATKKFDGRTIPDATIDELVDLVRFAPSAINLQPWKIRIVTDQALKAELRPAAHDQEQITSCSHLLVFFADTDYEGLIGNVDALMQRQGIPDETREQVIGMAREYASRMSPEQRFTWSQAQTYLAAGNAFNGAKALGFDSCPMSGFDQAAFSRILRTPAHLVPVILCPVGYAADRPMKKMRFSRDAILI